MTRLTKQLSSIAHKTGFHVSRYRKIEYPVFIPQDFRSLYERIEDLTLAGWSGSRDAYMAAKYVAGSVEGDVVECGVWRGGLSIVMAEALVDAGDTSRRVFLFDTFTGMTEPGENDHHVWRGKHAREKYLTLQRADHNEWVYSPIEEVRENLKRSRLPDDRFVLVKGPVEETVPREAPEKISLLRLDTDWYESTLHELTHLFPRLQPGGVLIVDDYSSWAGARRAVDEYFAQYKGRIFFQENAIFGSLIAVRQG